MKLLLALLLATSANAADVLGREPAQMTPRPGVKPFAVLKAKGQAKPKARPPIELGMSFSEVRASNWGAPTSRRTVVNSDGTWSFWDYGCGNLLTFLDGELYEIEMPE